MDPDDIAVDVDSSSIEFTLSSFLKPWDADDPEAYSCEIRGKIITHDDQDKEVPLGEIELLLVKTADAICDGAELAFIFDAVGLDDPWIALFAEEGSCPELAVQFSENDILFIGKVSVEEKYQGTSLRIRAIQTAVAMFLPVGTVIVHCDLLTDAEWSRFGGRQIPETDYICVRSPLAHP